MYVCCLLFVVYSYCPIRFGMPQDRAMTPAELEERRRQVKKLRRMRKMSRRLSASASTAATPAAAAAQMTAFGGEL